MQLTHARTPTVTVRLQPIGSAPHLNQRVFKLSTNQRFETIVRFLRKRLGAKEHESVFCYVGSVFSPALDEGVGNLWTVSRRVREVGGGSDWAGLMVRSALSRMRSWWWGMLWRLRLVDGGVWGRVRVSGGGRGCSRGVYKIPM
jgi:hypothetical protein